jgi:hypothetical protein
MIDKNHNKIDITKQSEKTTKMSSYFNNKQNQSLLIDRRIKNDTSLIIDRNDNSLMI